MTRTTKLDELEVSLDNLGSGHCITLLSVTKRSLLLINAIAAKRSAGKRKETFREEKDCASS
jgi:hypothetical protein